MDYLENSVSVDHCAENFFIVVAMRRLCCLNVLSFSVLGCAIIFTLVNAGKKVEFKFHVPELVNHKHHTNIVFVHKHHHHHPHHHQHHEHSYGGDPHSHHHTHSFGHHYSYNHGHNSDNGHKPHHHTPPSNHQGHGGHKPKPKLPHKKPAPKKPPHKKPIHQKPSHPKLTYPINPQGKTNYITFGGGHFDYPKTEVEHYVYSTSSPLLHFDDNNNLRESNQTIRHERLKIKTVGGDSDPETENYEEFSKTQSNSGYEVEEPSFDFGFEPYKVDQNKQTTFKGYQENVGYSYKDEEDSDEQNKGLGHYFEDYTNPNSVAKYTSDIQHGTINLEDSSYNPAHGNDLEEYIRASKDLDDY